MWIKRDFEAILGSLAQTPIKILRGPRQVGKTTFLERLGTHEIVYLDDATTRMQAQENPRFFLDRLPRKLILDEGILAPALFPELKRRIDEQRRGRGTIESIDYWITGSNQTLVRRNVRESLAGRASYFDFNSLSIHELGDRWSFDRYLLYGGWPELYVTKTLNPVRYLTDLIATFIEKDIVSAAGIERKEAFTKVLQLTAARIGQIFNASDIATVSGVDTTTVKSWVSILEDNGVLRSLPAYATNLNKRLIKSPKIYFEDVALATRLQGWSLPEPIMLSPLAGSLLENIAISEIVRFFINRGEIPQLSYIRSKEKVEVDLLIHLPNQKTIAAEVKMTPRDFTEDQLNLLTRSNLYISEYWIISPTPGAPFPNARIVTLDQIWATLTESVGPIYPP